MEVKEGVFTKLDEVAKPGAVLATNTSGLDVLWLPCAHILKTSDVGRREEMHADHVARPLACRWRSAIDIEARRVGASTAPGLATSSSFVKTPSFTSCLGTRPR